jgi:hypothetical protein
VNVTVEGHTLNLAIVPKPGAHSTLTLDSGNNFVSLTGTYKLPTNAFLHGGDVNVSLVP